MAGEPAAGAVRDGLIAGIPRGTPRPLYGALQLDPAAASAPQARSVVSRSEPITRPATVSRAGSVAVNGGGRDTDSGRASHVESFVDRLQAPARRPPQQRRNAT